MVQKFTFEELPLKDAYLIKPFFYSDNRGGFVKDYSKELFLENRIDHKLEEVFYTISHKGVIRSLHFQKVNQQPKLVRCISGKIFDGIVDPRPDSPTFKKWIGFYLIGENLNELLIPAHFAHGYLVIEDSIVSYKCAAPSDPEHDSGIIYNDLIIVIKLPYLEIVGIQNVLISEKIKI